MLSPTLKIACAVAGTGGIVGGGVASIYYLNTEKTIEKWLTNSDKSKAQLTERNKGEEGWKEIWNKYITANSKGNVPNEKDEWGLEDWSEQKSQKETVPSSFVKKCEAKKLEKVRSTEDPKYKKYIDWCTK